jgi:trigger factor
VTITIEETSPTRKAVILSVPSATITEYENELIKEFASQVRLPGFRPGKAPTHLVKRQFAKGIADELKNKVVSEGFKHIREESKLNIYTIVDVKGTDEISPSADATLRFEIDLNPEFELPEYKGLEITEEAVVVTDEDVQKTIETIRSQRARFEVVDRGAEKGDYVKVGYEGTIDGTAVKEIAPDAYLYGSQPTTWEEAGAEEAPGIPGIVAGIVGKKAGDKFEVTHEFPADFNIEALKDKKATYAVEVFEVRAKILPEMDEEFFKSANAKDIEDLTKQVHDGIQKRKENDIRAKKRQDVIELLNSKVDFPLPESAIDREAYNIFIEFANMQLRQGMDVKEIEAQRDELMAGSKDAAKTRVKTQMILGKIAEKEELKVDQKELNERIVQEAYIAQTPVDKFAKELSKDRERIAEMHRWILFNKALDLVIDAAKVKAA